jgi:hypothetical protein
MLSIRQAAQQFPGVTEYFLRMMVKQNPCPVRVVRVGAKYLVNAESLAAWLSGGNAEVE